MKAMYTTAFVSNRAPLALLYLLLYCQTCLATADEIAKRQDTPNSTGLGKLETLSPVPVELTLIGRQETETLSSFPNPPTTFDTSPGFTTTRRPPETTGLPPPPTSPPPPTTQISAPAPTTTTSTSTSPGGRTTSTTFRDRTPTLTVESGITTTIEESSLATGGFATGTSEGAEAADPTSSFTVGSLDDSELYARMQDLRRFGVATIALLVINALLFSTALGFAIFIYFKHFRGHKPSAYAPSTFSSSSASLIPNKRQSGKGTLATASLSGTVPRALAGRQIPSHHYPRRSWDQVTTIASTSTESDRRRRQRVSRVEEESEDASLADTDTRTDPFRRSMQSSVAETDTSMIRSSSGVSVTLESSGRGTGVR